MPVTSPVRHADLISQLKELCAREIAPAARDVDRDRRFPRQQLQSLAKLGLWGLLVAPEHGGLGADAATFVTILQELGQACSSTAMVFLMHSVAAATLQAKANEEQARKYLRPIAEGRLLTTLAFSESGSGAHFYAPVSQARRDGNGYVLDADKSFVTSAGEADLYIAISRAPEAQGPTDSTLFLVPRDAAGVAIAAPWEGLGLNGNASSPLTFRGLRVAEGDRLGQDGEGFNVLLSAVLPWFQLGTSAVYTGIAKAALGATIGHVKQRRYAHSGSGLAELQAIQHHVAEMQLTAHQADLLTQQAASLVDAGRDDALLTVLESKIAACEGALAVTDLAMRVCGGAAFAARGEAAAIERLFRDARAGAVMAPTTEVLKDFVGKAMLGLPLF